MSHRGQYWLPAEATGEPSDVRVNRDVHRRVMETMGETIDVRVNRDVHRRVMETMGETIDVKVNRDVHRRTKRQVDRRTHGLVEVEARRAARAAAWTPPSSRPSCPPAQSWTTRPEAGWPRPGSSCPSGPPGRRRPGRRRRCPWQPLPSIASCAIVAPGGALECMGSLPRGSTSRGRWRLGQHGCVR